MPEPSLFRHYQIVQDAAGNNVELARDAAQVVVLAFDTEQAQYVHCHVLLEPLADKAAFERDCRRLRQRGHPLLARLVDCGEDEGSPFYITAHIDGETLQAWLQRQADLPAWLALQVACRTLEVAVLLAERGLTVPMSGLASLRLLQTGPQTLRIQAADYRLPAGGGAPLPSFEPAGLRSLFLSGVAGSFSAAVLRERLSACFAAWDDAAVGQLRDLLTTLQQLQRSVLEELAEAHRPRPVLAACLPTPGQVAKALTDQVRIAAQTLDPASPYSLHGTRVSSGRAVRVEPLPPAELAGTAVLLWAQKAVQPVASGDHPGLLAFELLQEGEAALALAEERVEGFHVADLLREVRALDVRDAHRLLSAIDLALSGLEAAGVAVPRLRLEDLFIRTGFPPGDERNVQLRRQRLSEWTLLSVVLRIHPTLDAMTGRGLDPAVLLPPDLPLWQGPWLAALARFLIGLEAVPGQPAPVPKKDRALASVTQWLEAELAQAQRGAASTREAFLAGFGRLLERRDAAPALPPLAAPSGGLRAVTRPSVMPIELQPAAPLTHGVSTPAAKPDIGFAELLFRDTSVVEAAGTAPDWAKTAADAPPTIQPNEVLLPPSEFVPLWLRAAVFLGGSMIAGAVLAHVSGHAFWRRPPAVPAPPVAVPVRPVEKARPGESLPLQAAPEVKVPDLPPEAPPPAGGLRLQPPPSSLKKDLL